MKMTDEDIKKIVYEDFCERSREWTESLLLKRPKEKYINNGGILNFITKNDFHIDPEEEEMFILFRENRKEWEKRMKQQKQKRK